MISQSYPDRIRITVDDHGVAEVCLVRSDKMNALDPKMFAALVEAIANLKTSEKVRVVVLHGEGKAFCAGLDMASFAAMDSQNNGSVDAPPELTTRTQGIANTPQHIALGWRELPVPVIAAVHGAAFGGGLQLALGADIRIVSPDTQMSVLEIKWGLVPDMAGMVLMRYLLRDDVARALTYTGRMVGAEEAVRIGLATQVSDEPLTTAREIARTIASKSPSAIRAGKRLFNESSQILDESAAALLMRESIEQMALIGNADQLESVRANLEKRPARYH